MKLSLIAAVAANGTIGRGGGLPWRLRSDLREFKRRTLGKPIIMGRKTWEALPKRPLEGRLNIVLSRRDGYAAEGACVVRSLDEARARARDSGAEEAFVIGGSSIYEAALPSADELVITHVLAAVEGDASFPDVDWSAWRSAPALEVPASERDEHAFRVVVYRRP